MRLQVCKFSLLFPISWFLKNSWPLKFGFWPFHATLTFSPKSFQKWSFHVILRKPLHVRTWFAQKKHKSLHPSSHHHIPAILLSYWLTSLGNFEAEDSEAKQKYDAQVQINLQLQEQKKWLEHELEEVGRMLKSFKQWRYAYIISRFLSMWNGKIGTLYYKIMSEKIFLVPAIKC